MLNVTQVVRRQRQFSPGPSNNGSTEHRAGERGKEVAVCVCVYEAAREEWRAGPEPGSVPANYYRATAPVTICISLETVGATREGLLDPSASCPKAGA